jgi:hypothetical protein
MDYKVDKVKAPGRDEVELLRETFEDGQPDDNELGKWRQKLSTRDTMLKYLRTGERYWYSDDWYGSEKRKNPA